MKQLLGITALLGAFLLLNSPAHANGSGQFTIGGDFTFRFFPGGGGGAPPQQLGPWYQYWPLEAHFQTPAPLAFPYWPQTPMQGAQAPLPGMAPTGIQPTGYFQAPSYWYGR